MGDILPLLAPQEQVELVGEVIAALHHQLLEVQERQTRAAAAAAHGVLAAQLWALAAQAAQA